MKKSLLLVLLISIISSAKAQQYSDSIMVSHLSKVMLVFDQRIDGNPVPGSAMVTVTKLDDKRLVLEGNASMIGPIVKGGGDVPPTNLLVTAGNSYYNFHIRYERNLTRHIVSPDMYKAIYTGASSTPATPASSTDSRGYEPNYDLPETFAKSDLLTELDESEEMVIYGGRFGDVKLFYATTNLWVDEKNLYVRVKVENQSSTPYNIEYFRFFISDTKWSTNKKNTPRLTDLEPVDKLREIKYTIDAEEIYTNVFVFDKFTLYDKQNFNIQVGEVNGGRKATCSMNRKEMFIAEKLD